MSWIFKQTFLLSSKIFGECTYTVEDKVVDISVVDKVVDMAVVGKVVEDMAAVEDMVVGRVPAGGKMQPVVHIVVLGHVVSKVEELLDLVVHLEKKKKKKKKKKANDIKEKIHYGQIQSLVQHSNIWHRYVAPFSMFEGPALKVKIWNLDLNLSWNSRQWETYIIKQALHIY